MVQISCDYTLTIDFERLDKQSQLLQSLLELPCLDDEELDLLKGLITLTSCIRLLATHGRSALLEPNFDHAPHPANQYLPASKGFFT